MKLAITGATGFVGQQIVPALKRKGIDLLLIGRNVELMKSIHPDTACVTYDDMTRHLNGVDCLLHMAVLNNDSGASQDLFTEVNVTLFRDVLTQAKSAGVGRVINLTSFHALEDTDTSNYAVSKRTALHMVDTFEDLDVISVFLPAVYGDTYSGKLANLNKLPGFAAKALFRILAAFRATVHIDKLIGFLCQADVQTKAAPQNVFLYDGQSDNFTYFLGRKTIDLCFASAVAVFAGWALVIVWILIQLETKGPGIFKQARVGRAGRTFTCYKLRTMFEDTIQAGTHEVSSVSVTRLGKFLRKTKLDELPQILNLIKGDLSLVGPRPCLPSQTAIVGRRRSSGVSDITPGITGLAQVNNVDMSDLDQLIYWDTRYVAQQCLLLDIKLIFVTLTGSGQGDRTSAD